MLTTLDPVVAARIERRAAAAGHEIAPIPIRPPVEARARLEIEAGKRGITLD